MATLAKGPKQPVAPAVSAGIDTKTPKGPKPKDPKKGKTPDGDADAKDKGKGGGKGGKGKGKRKGKGGNSESSGSDTDGKTRKDIPKEHRRCAHHLSALCPTKPGELGTYGPHK